MTAPAAAPVPTFSYLLPPSFKCPTIVEDLLTPFEAFSRLYKWVDLTLDPRPQLFSAHLNSADLTFYRSHATAQKGNYDDF